VYLLFLPQKREVFWTKQQKYRSKHGKPYLAELVIKFPIDWHFNLKNLIFERFSQKWVMSPLIKNAKICGILNFSKPAGK